MSSGSRPGQGDLFSLPPATTRPAAAPAPVVKSVAPVAVARAALAAVAVASPLEHAPVLSASIERPSAPLVLSVGELTQRIQGALESRFGRVLVRGEVTGFRGPNARGHLYFSLKDADACIDVCIWASQAQRLRFRLKDGLSVVAEGSVDVYAPRGRYSLIAHRLEPEGEGALALAFQQLRERLSTEGLMGENRKRAPRPLPFLPLRIGIVTSRTAAALQDFLRILHTRHPRLHVLLSDARMQGEDAAQDVCRALERLYRTDVDVIVVTRGGGSLEDLWTFNEESVARTIHASPVPVVSAIGHEVDFTIADFVADHRAPTPSAAAERLAPVLADLELGLKNAQSRIWRASERTLLRERARLSGMRSRLPDLRRWIGSQRHRLSDQADGLGQLSRSAMRQRREAVAVLRERLQRQHPQAQLRAQRQKLQRLQERLLQAGRAALTRAQAPLQRSRMALAHSSPLPHVHRSQQRVRWLEQRLPETARQGLVRHRARLHQLAGRLEAMSPLAVLSRGYSITVRARDGHVLRRGTDVSVGEQVLIRVAENAHALDECQTVEAQVTAIRAARSGGI